MFFNHFNQNPAITTLKAVYPATSIDFQGPHHDDTAICGNVACTCLLDPCSQNRFQILRLLVFRLFLLFGEVLPLVTSFTCFAVFHSCVPVCASRCAKIYILLLILNNFHFILSIFLPFAVKYSVHIIIWSLKLVTCSLLVANMQNAIHYYKVVLTICLIQLNTTDYGH